MLTLFRNFFQSKVGIVITLAFVGLIAFAFASMDVSNSGTFGGVAGGDRVAVVGDQRITTSDLSVNATNQLDQMRQQNPTITMQAFVEEGGLDDVLQTLISRWGISEFAQSLGLRAGSRLIDSEIVQIPAFTGLDGAFSEEMFRQALAQRNLSEDLVRQDLGMGLLSRQLMTPAALASRMPASLSRKYAELLGETRSGTIAPLPSSAFEPETDPSEQQLKAFYDENRTRYIRPERRVIRYALFNKDSLAQLPAPTGAQIAARYERDAQTYAEIELRGLTQLVLPTQQAAQAIVDEVKGGIRLEASAQSKGLATTNVPTTDRAALTSSTSKAVADAAFAVAEGSVSAPAQGPLGWYIFRVDSVGKQEGRSLNQVRGEIATRLAEEQRLVAFSEAIEDIDNAFADGASMAEMVSQYKLELVTTPDLTAAGQVYGTADSAPQELARVLNVAFDMEEGEPQIAETIAGETLVLFDVAQITLSAAAPMSEIKDTLIAAWRRSEGMNKAGEAAARILERVSGGATLADAVKAEKVTLPAPQAVTLNRREVAQQRQLTPVTTLFFSMAEGTTKRVEQDPSSSWFVVSLADITTPEIAADDPMVAATANQLASTAGGEYLEQFARAIENSLEVDINENAVAAVRTQLTGGQ